MSDRAPMTAAEIEMLRLSAKANLDAVDEDGYACPVLVLPSTMLRLLADLERAREILEHDAAGRPLSALLEAAADALRCGGGGPVEDCLRLKANQISAYLDAARGKAEKQ